MFEQFAKRWLGARKRGAAKSRVTKRRKAKAVRAKTACQAGLAKTGLANGSKAGPGLLAALAKRPALLLACGAGIGLIIGALVATTIGEPARRRHEAAGEFCRRRRALGRAAEGRRDACPPAPALPPSGPCRWPRRRRGVRPPWQQYAKAVPETAGRPMIAIVIDDMGIDKADSARVIDLPPAITIAFMTYAKDLARQAAAARAAGHELWLHVPMEPLDGELDAGPHALKTSLTPEENRQRLDWALAQLDGYVGINNHMGSRFTSSEAE